MGIDTTAIRVPISFGNIAIYKQDIPKITKVIFNNPATVVMWADGSKTVVKCGEKDTYDKEKGLAMCIVKKISGNKGSYNDVFKKWIQ